MIFATFDSELWLLFWKNFFIIKSYFKKIINCNKCQQQQDAITAIKVLHLSQIGIIIRERQRNA
jgi:hypothetical protein